MRTGARATGFARGIGVAALLAAWLSGCATPPSGPPTLSLHRIDPATLPGWDADRLSEVLPGFLSECTALGRVPAETRLGGAAGTEAGATAGRYLPVCRAAAALRNPDEAALHRFFATWFLFYEVANGDDPDARFTGYYEPEVAGSLSPGPEYRVPVYARPRELGPPGTPVAPRWTREQIDHGALARRGLELVWLHDPVDLFFLQIQGSGRVRLPSGQIVRLGYDGRNGQPYVPLGRVLVQNGELQPDDVSMQSVRAWLEAHPAQAVATMEQNPNYVFFRSENALLPGEGPEGALGVPLEPLRSAAVDRAFLPLGAPLFVETETGDGQKLDRLMLAQDVGADITGPARADLFFGWGKAAAAAAGHMHGTGHLVLLLPRQPGAR